MGDVSIGARTHGCSDSASRRARRTAAEAVAVAGSTWRSRPTPAIRQVTADGAGEKNLDRNPVGAPKLNRTDFYDGEPVKHQVRARRGRCIGSCSSLKAVGARSDDDQWRFLMLALAPAM